MPSTAITGSSFYVPVIIMRTNIKATGNILVLELALKSVHSMLMQRIWSLQQRLLHSTRHSGSQSLLIWMESEKYLEEVANKKHKNPYIRVNFH